MSTAPCPTCRKPADQGKQNPSRPFCCNRCKLVDLGRWLDGSYVVPGEPALDFEAADLSEVIGNDDAGSSNDRA